MVRRGEIVEEGTHADLVRVSDGAYATLVRLQQQRAAAGEEDADSLVRRVRVRVMVSVRMGTNLSPRAKLWREVDIHLRWPFGVSRKQDSIECRISSGSAKQHCGPGKA